MRVLEANSSHFCALIICYDLSSLEKNPPASGTGGWLCTLWCRVGSLAGSAEAVDSLAVTPQPCSESGPGVQRDDVLTPWVGVGVGVGWDQSGTRDWNVGQAAEWRGSLR